MPWGHLILPTSLADSGGRADDNSMAGSGLLDTLADAAGEPLVPMGSDTVRGL